MRSSIWYQTQYLFPLLWTPFTLRFRQRTIAYALETSILHLLALLSILSWISIRELLSATFLVVVYQIIYPAEIHSSVYPLNLSLVRWNFRRKDDDFIMMTWSRERKTSIYWVDLFEKSNQDQEGSLEFRNLVFPLTPLLNFGTSYLVVEEICDARIVTLQ